MAVGLLSISSQHMLFAVDAAGLYNCCHYCKCNSVLLLACPLRLFHMVIQEGLMKDNGGLHFGRGAQLGQYCQ